MTSGSILLHRVPDDPVQQGISEAMKTATYDTGSRASLSVLLLTAAAHVGVTFDKAAAAAGFRVVPVNIDYGDGEHALDTMHLVPDGVRACYGDRCTHPRGYVPPAQEGTTA